MLLQHILHQLDGELVRLRSLRTVVAGLARSPAVLRTLTPKLDQLLKPESAAGAAVAVVASAPARRPGRPRKTSETAVVRARPAGVSRAARTTPAPSKGEPKALSKALSAGPVVVSAVALARERELRASAKAAAQVESEAAPALALRSETSARELAARWLISPAKA